MRVFSGTGNVFYFIFGTGNQAIFSLGTGNSGIQRDRELAFSFTGKRDSKALSPGSGNKINTFLLGTGNGHFFSLGTGKRD